MSVTLKIATDHYLPETRIWFGTVTFAMGLTIPDKEFELCRKLVMPGFAALSLTNDLYSWGKERDAANRNGSPNVVNAIWVIMNENSIVRSKRKRSVDKRLRTLLPFTETLWTLAKLISQYQRICVYMLKQ